MKVAIITPVYPPYRGGMGAVAARDAADLKARGVEATVFTPKYEVADPSTGSGQGEVDEVKEVKGVDGVPEVVALRPWLAIGNAAVLPQLLWRLSKFDVVHLHYPFFGADIFVALACLWRRMPLVITYHMVATAPDFRQKIFSLHRRLLEPFILWTASRVLVSSFDYATAIGLRHRQLIERPLGVNTERFAPGDRLEARQRLSILPREKVILFVGGLDSAHFFKGLGALLIAVRELDALLPWRLLIVGEGNLRPNYEKMVRDLDITGRVTFLGNLASEVLPIVYRAADLHVLPSIEMNEAFGLVTLEAAASGIPSIVTDLPGVRTVVVPFETGIVVQPKDVATLSLALDRLLTNDELREHCGAVARQRALERYDETKLADDLLPLYKELTNNRH